jgi:pyruvate-ferredoxin/flavodoxin oxidoreductase
LVGTPDFVAVHVSAYLDKYDCLKGLKQGGTFLYNSIWDVEETKKRLPDHVKKYLAENGIKMYIINASYIAEEIGLGNRTNTILQSAFFKISGVIPYDLAVEQMKKFIVKSYGRKGENIVKMNYAAVDRGGDIQEVIVPAEWANITVTPKVDDPSNPAFINKVMLPMMAQKGNDLPVSAFTGYENGTFPAGTTTYEKRGIAITIPEWISENCIQCNQCSYVCPHAVIRPVVMTDEEKAKAPAGMNTLDMKVPKEMAGMHFRMQVSPLDCTGCGNCVDICPAKNKALVLAKLEEQLKQVPYWEYAQKEVTYKDHLIDKMASVKNSQFAQPLFEFSGACAGCGETPYIKAVTQLFGEQMLVANATGCSSIYGGSAPSTPYCKNNKSGCGPAWANSLFEDNAEYGLGMAVANRQMRDRLKRIMKEAIAECNCCTDALKTLFSEWIANRENSEICNKISTQIVIEAAKCDCSYCREIINLKQYLAKKSHWIIGGDGWAYDIGFGGLDHVLASGENVNVLVLDTEVYSNTGGQSSKATPAGAVAKFATSGKKIRKKDLGMIAKSYGYVYVAQVAMGANQAQYLKAIKEAEAFNGPSIVICYAPCINHGISTGMGTTQREEKRAVECGYWHLWRFNPETEEQNGNGFSLDSAEPNWSKFRDFIMSEVRYNSLLKTFPQEAEELFAATEKNAKWRYEGYKKLAESR